MIFHIQILRIFTFTSAQQDVLALSKERAPTTLPSRTELLNYLKRPCNYLPLYPLIIPIIRSPFRYEYSFTISLEKLNNYKRKLNLKLR